MEGTTVFLLRFAFEIMGFYIEGRIDASWVGLSYNTMSGFVLLREWCLKIVTACFV